MNPTDDLVVFESVTGHVFHWIASGCASYGLMCLTLIGEISDQSGVDHTGNAAFELGNSGKGPWKALS